jgi:hypothetical protein
VGVDSLSCLGERRFELSYLIVHQSKTPNPRYQVTPCNIWNGIVPPPGSRRPYLRKLNFLLVGGERWGGCGGAEQGLVGDQGEGIWERALRCNAAKRGVGDEIER